ncbi:hypothetical protein [Bacillus solitudinis]|uniref:hypothetical protein n=1 Tax=Bacillus solitudinis TaxID=2014074 RepID=UPI000C240201|nr:hypothetical protein [Bacillus solitudinis]
MYLLDRVKKIEKGKLIPRSYLISNQKINYVNESLNKWKEQRLNAEGFMLDSGNIMIDNELLSMDFSAFQQQQRQLLKKGCTTVAVFNQVNYEKQLLTQLKNAKHRMTNSSLDFVIGLSMSLHLLRPTVIRSCQKYKIPVLKIQVSTGDNLQDVPWTHIAQALLSYQVVLLLDIIGGNKRERQAIAHSWYWFCQKYRIPTGEVPDPHRNWPKSLLQKTGLYPIKGELLIGSDVDYLLYLDYAKTNLDSQALSVEEDSLLDYDKEEPNIVVLRGRNLKINDEYFLKPGFGYHIQVKKPGRFVPITEAHDYNSSGL